MNLLEEILASTHQTQKILFVKVDDVLRFPSVVMETEVKEEVWPCYAKHLDIHEEYFRNAAAQSTQIYCFGICILTSSLWFLMQAAL